MTSRKIQILGIAAAVLLLAAFLITSAVKAQAPASPSPGVAPQNAHPKGNWKQMKRKPQVVAWSELQGRPVINQAQKDSFYIWREGNVVHIATTQKSKQEKPYISTVFVKDGTIADVKSTRQDTAATRKQPKPNILVLSNDTANGNEEIVFTVNGGKQLGFMVGRNPRNRYWKQGPPGKNMQPGQQGKINGQPRQTPSPAVKSQAMNGEKPEKFKKMRHVYYGGKANEAKRGRLVFDMSK